MPDTLGQLTSDHGWDTVKHKDFLIEMINIFHKEKIRVSIFVDPHITMVEGAKETGTDRIELYTEAYAKESMVNGQWSIVNGEKAIKPYVAAAKKANELGLGINAGHDLDLKNLQYFSKNIPGLLEVSIGHALICDAIYLFEIQSYE